MKFFIIALATIAAASAAPGVIIGGIASTISPLSLNAPIASSSLLATPVLRSGLLAEPAIAPLPLGLNTLAAPAILPLNSGLITDPVATLPLGLNTIAAPGITTINSGLIAPATLPLGLNMLALPAINPLSPLGAELIDPVAALRLNTLNAPLGIWKKRA